MEDEEMSNEPAAENTMGQFAAPIIQTSRQSALRPLQAEGRYREPQVEAQIVFLRRCPSTEFWRRARLRDPHSADYVQPETLVYLLRERRRGGDSETAWKIAELLLDRHARAIHQQVMGWRLSRSQQEECLRDLQVRILEDLCDESRGCEFWEVRFWLCLRRRAQNIVQKYLTVTSNEFTPEPLEDDEGNRSDRMESLPALENLTPELRVQMAEALALLTPQERLAFVLTHFEGWSQEQIAQRLGVVDRTVRNLLTRAEGKLASWRSSNL